MYTTKKEISPAYFSKNNSNCEKQIILFMISNEEKAGWHYIAVKKLSSLLRGITSKHGDVYCLNCLHSFKIENKLESHQKVLKKKDFCRIVMPSEMDQILDLNNIWSSIKCHT